MADVTEIKHRIKSIERYAPNHESDGADFRCKDAQGAGEAYVQRGLFRFGAVYAEGHSCGTARTSGTNTSAHRPDSRTAYIVIAGDKGLAGAFNNNVLEPWRGSHMQDRPVHYVITVGQMARAFFETEAAAGRSRIYACGNRIRRCTTPAGSCAIYWNCMTAI